MTANHLIPARAYINGKFLTSRKTFDVVNPATGETLASVPDLSVSDCRKAIKHADAAWSAWRNTDTNTRSNIVRKWYELILTNKPEIARIMTQESGKPLTE